MAVKTASAWFKEEILKYLKDNKLVIPGAVSKFEQADASGAGLVYIKECIDDAVKLNNSANAEHKKVLTENQELFNKLNKSLTNVSSRRQKINEEIDELIKDGKLKRGKQTNMFRKYLYNAISPTGVKLNSDKLTVACKETGILLGNDPVAALNTKAWGKLSTNMGDLLDGDFEGDDVYGLFEKFNGTSANASVAG